MSLMLESHKERAGLMDRSNVFDDRQKEYAMSFCERFSFLMTPIHSSFNDDNHKSYQIVLLPETYFLYAILYFWFFLIICIIVTLTSSTRYDPNSNPIQNRDGYNIICVYWDFPPITFYATPLYLPVVMFILIFFILDLLRVYYSFKKDEFINFISYKIYKIFAIFYMLGILFSINFTSTDPEETLFWHSLPYLTLIIGIWITNALQIYYYYKIKLFDGYKQYKSFNVLSIIYIVLMGLVILYKILWSTTNLVAILAEIEELHFSKLYPQILPFGRIIEYLFLFLVAIIPLPIKLWIAPQLKDKCVKFKMDYDVQFDSARIIPDM